MNLEIWYRGLRLLMSMQQISLVTKVFSKTVPTREGQGLQVCGGPRIPFGFACVGMQVKEFRYNNN